MCIFQNVCENYMGIFSHLFFLNCFLCVVLLMQNLFLSLYLFLFLLLVFSILLFLHEESDFTRTIVCNKSRYMEHRV